MKWPPAVTDLASIEDDTTILRLVTGVKRLVQLGKFSLLQALWCFDINSEALSHICKCVALENLYIETLKANSIDCIRNLPALKVLSLDSSSKIASLDVLDGLQNLEGLAIINFKKVHDVNPLSKFINLEQLAIAGSIWTRMTIESFQPLSSLRNLRYLHLTNLKAQDESLRPLGELSQLENLEIANFYPAKELAWLSGKLKNTKCSWFSPYIKFPLKCSRCSGDTMVMLTGKGKPRLCRACDSSRLEKHVAEFETIAANATYIPSDL